jgi:hypothetical protein
VFQQLAMGLGISVSAAVLTLVANGRTVPNLGDFSGTFLIMAMFPLLSLPMIFSLRNAERARLQMEDVSVSTIEEAEKQMDDGSEAAVAPAAAKPVPPAEPMMALTGGDYAPDKNRASVTDETCVRRAKRTNSETA